MQIIDLNFFSGRESGLGWMSWAWAWAWAWVELSELYSLWAIGIMAFWAYGLGLVELSHSFSLEDGLDLKQAKKNEIYQVCRLDLIESNFSIIVLSLNDEAWETI